MRIVLLDVMRSVAIIMLLIAHIAQAIQSPLGDFFGPSSLYRVSLGGLAVTLFLMISGMALGLQYQDKKIRFPQFIIKRCLRIYPVYYMSLIIGVAVYLIKIHSDMGDEVSHILNLYDVFLSLTGFYPFVGYWGGPFVATSWFIGLIMVMYALFPILLKWVKSRPHQAIMVLFLVSLLSRLLLGRYPVLGHRPLDWFPLCRVFEFGFGIYLAMLIQHDSLRTMVKLNLGAPFFRFISDISFPLFLIHYPLLFIIDSCSGYGIHPFFSIALFLGISILLSGWALFVDNRIPRAVILRKVFKREGHQ